MNVNVYCRVRPSKSEVPNNSHFQVISNSQIQVFDNAFSLDKIFTESTNQEELFASIVEPNIQYCLEGFNLTLFTYGQTGSGKVNNISQ